MAQTTPKSDDQSPEETLEQLRRLLLGPDLEKLADLDQRIGDTDRFSTEVANVLPLATAKSTAQSKELSEVMVPTVEEIVRLSIKKDVNKFASALFPVIGPALRKSISETMRQMLQSLNQALEHGLSWQGLKWRIQSMRTGVPFAQLVMLNSLAYRVEQVFLIHRETGLLLHHVHLDDALAQNADMVSSMLSAIGDFVTDSFQSSGPQQLDSLQVGDFRIVIEQAPSVALAVVIRGDAPSDIGRLLIDVLEDIHKQLGDELAEFDGNTEPFAATDRAMRRCLVHSAVEQTRQKMSLTTRLVWATVIALVLFWLGGRVLLAVQQDQFLESLESVPGLVLTRIERSGRHLAVEGLRDALAADPAKLLAASDLEAGKVSLAFVPFFSLEAEFVERRLLDQLAPPPSVAVMVSDGGVVLTGSAQHAWIERAHRVLENHPFINSADFDGIVDTTREALEASVARLEEWSILYEPNDAEFSAAQREQLRRATEYCKKVIRLARELDLTPTIRVRGSTDSSGTFRRNVELSLARAERVRGFLVDAGVRPEYLLARGLEASVAEEASPEEQRRNRRVFFSVDLGDAGKAWR